VTRITTILIAAICASLCAFPPAALAQAETPRETGFTLLTDEVVGDFKYIADNIQMDAIDVVTSPLYVASDKSLLRSPTFYLALAGAGAAFGGAFALDQTMRAQLRDMKSSTATELENISYGGVGGLSALVYAYGLYSDDAKVRETMLTGAESAGVASLVVLALKPAFGRLRPRQDHHSHTTFFDGGASFPSGEVTPMFSLAAGISQAFDNRWYVAIPAYSLATADGFGRMGHDAHWFSDVVGAALLGVGTTELLLYLHRQHAAQLDRWRIFPVNGSPGKGGGSGATPQGLGISYNW
jgi:membrane-associated phospholipid phosphatase